MRLTMLCTALLLAACWTVITEAQTGIIVSPEVKCYWSGTSPFCSGHCSKGHKTVRIDSRGDGRSCVTGTKKLCCPPGAVPPGESGVRGCHWVGTSPMCSGSCPKGYHVNTYDKSGDGRTCIFGSKRFCCPNRT